MPRNQRVDLLTLFIESLPFTQYTNDTRGPREPICKQRIMARVPDHERARSQITVLLEVCAFLPSGIRLGWLEGGNAQIAF